MSLYLDVSVYGGVSIKDAAIDACRLAFRTGVTVHFRFNGVSCSAHPGGQPATLIENWYAASKADSGYPMASTHKRSSETVEAESHG